MAKFLIKVLISSVAIYLTARWVGGVEIIDNGTTESTIIVVALVGLVFTAVNAVIKPVVQVLSIPFYILTLGLFFLVVNGAMLMLTSWVTSHFDYGLTVDSFGTAVWASVIISLISLILALVLPSGEKKRS